MRNTYQNNSQIVVNYRMAIIFFAYFSTYTAFKLTEKVPFTQYFSSQFAQKASENVIINLVLCSRFFFFVLQQRQTAPVNFSFLSYQNVG